MTCVGPTNYLDQPKNAVFLEGAMERLAKVLGILVFSLLIPVSLGFGQSPTGGVNGTVTDPTGALVPGVRVTLTNQAPGFGLTGGRNAGGIIFFVMFGPGMK